MDFEMDQTQALPMDDDDDPEEQSPPDTVVAQLKVLSCKGFPETIFDLKEGENVIGRHATNNIAIPLKSLSKQHACIEIHGDSHLIHDMGSRNRTRRGKLFLKPNIRYEVKNCDVLTLADITCQYLIPEQDDHMSDSSDSVDLLQPTQAFPALADTGDKQNGKPPSTSSVIELKTPSHTSPRRVFAEDSDDNMPSSGDKTPGNSNNSFIPDTQQPAGVTPPSNNNIMVQDSDSDDTDMEEDNTANNTNNNVKSLNETDLDLSGLGNASTLVVNQSDLANGSKDPANASTLAITESPVANKSDPANASTLAVIESPVASKSDPANASTLAVNGNDGEALDPADLATQAYQADENEEEEAAEESGGEDKKEDVSDEATLAYQTGEDDEDDDKTADHAMEATQAFAMPFPVDKGAAPSPIARNKEDEPMDMDDSMADEPTQAFMKPIMNSTQEDDVADQSTMVDDAVEATQAYGMDDSMAPTQPFRRGGDPAVDQTQAYGANGDDDAMAATQAYRADVADQSTLAYMEEEVSSPLKGKDGKDDDDDDTDDQPTQAYGLDDACEATQAYVSNEDDGDETMAATQAYGSIADQPTLAYGAMNGDDDDDDMAPTQAYGDVADQTTLAAKAADDDETDDDMAPTQAYGDVTDQATLAYGGRDEDDDDDMAPTQAYGDPAAQSTLAYDMGNDVEDDDDMAPTQAYGVDEEDDDMAPTQAYGDVDDQEKDVAEESTLPQGDGEDSVVTGDGDSSKAVKQPDVDDDTEEPTQAFGIEEDKEPDDTEEPTQAYGVDQEPALAKGNVDDDDEPTQAYRDDNTEEMSSEAVVKKDEEEEDEGETQIPDSEGEEEDAVAPGGRRLVSILAQQIPVKSALSPGRDKSKNKRPQRVSFQVQTPDSEEDSEEIPPPTKRSTRGGRGRKSKPEEEKKDDEGNEDEEEATDDVDIAPTRIRSLRHKKKTKKDTEDGGSPTKDTGKEDKVSKKPPPAAAKNAAKKDAKPTGKKSGGRMKGIAAGSRKIVEFFQPASPEESSEELESVSSNKGKGSKSGDKTASKGTKGKKAKRMPSRRKAAADYVDAEEPEYVPSTSDESVTEVDAKMDSKTTKRGTSKGQLVEDESSDSQDAKKSLRNAPKGESVEEHDVDSKETTKRSTRGASKDNGDDEGNSQETRRSGRGTSKGVKAIDGKVDSKTTQKSVRGASKFEEDDADKDVKTGARKGKKGSEQSPATETKTGNSKSESSQDDDNDGMEKSPLTRTVEIRIPKIDAKSCETDEPSKINTRKGGRRSVATTSKNDEVKDSGKSEAAAPAPQRPSRSLRGKQNDDEVNDEKNGKKDSGATTTRATRGKAGNKNDAKVEQKKEEANTDGAKTRPARGKKRGAKDEDVDKKDEAKAPQAKSGNKKTAISQKELPETSTRKSRTKGNEKQEEVPETSSRSSRNNADTKRPELAETSTRSNRSKSNEKTADTGEAGSSKRGRRQTPSPDPSPMRSSSGRQSRKKTPSPTPSEKTKPAEEFKKPAAVGKSTRGKSAVAKKEEGDDTEANKAPSRRGRNTKRGPSPETAASQSTSAPSTSVSKRGKRNQSPSPTPPASPSSSPFPSPSPSKRGRRSETLPNDVNSPTLRRRSSDSKPKVMFTGVTDKDWEKIVTSLGGELVDSVYECTHLVTDKVRRTVKFLCCMAKGAVIVNPKWLDMCKVSKSFVDPLPYLLKDRAAEKQHKFVMLTSHQKASKEQLLKGSKVHVTAGVKPEPQQMKDIIKCAGGEFLTKLAAKPSADTIIVTCEEDRPSIIKHTSIPIVSAEFILAGILRQDAEPANYQLEASSTATTSTTTTSKRRASTQPTHGGKKKR